MNLAKTLIALAFLAGNACAADTETLSSAATAGTENASYQASMTELAAQLDERFSAVGQMAYAVTNSAPQSATAAEVQALLTSGARDKGLTIGFSNGGDCDGVSSFYITTNLFYGPYTIETGTRIGSNSRWYSAADRSYIVRGEDGEAKEAFKKAFSLIMDSAR